MKLRLLYFHGDNLNFQARFTITQEGDSAFSALLARSREFDRMREKGIELPRVWVDQQRSDGDQKVR